LGDKIGGGRRWVERRRSSLVYEGERGEGNFGELALKADRLKGETGSGTGSSSAAKWIEMEGTGDGGRVASISGDKLGEKRGLVGRLVGQVYARGKRRGEGRLGEEVRREGAARCGREKSYQHLAEGRRSW
jgi:hypothetical protein